MGWLIAVGVLLGIAILPVGVSIIYDDQGSLIRLLLGPVRVQLFPAKKKAVTPKQHEKEAASAKSAAHATASRKKAGGKLTDFLPIVEIFLQLLCKFKNKIRVNRLEMTLILAGDDPCDLAINYGKAWAALGNLMPQLERFFVIKKRDLEVECDFTSDSTKIYARLDLSITVGRLLALASVYGLRLLGAYRKIMKIRKGGAQT